jgi:hypothetical protein
MLTRSLPAAKGGLAAALGCRPMRACGPAAAHQRRPVATRAAQVEVDETASLVEGAA